jgi:enoyl-[acyl-carrier protein] reductase II
MKQLNELLGTRYPFIQGGMANIATGEFAAACSNAGALGLIASGGLHSAEELRNQIRICRSLTDQPFGVNLMLMNPAADEMAQVLTEEGVRVVTTGAGNPGQYMKDWKDHGMTVIPVSASVALAKRLIRSGADAIIAEGTESGGHVGEMTTMTLVPQMVDGLDGKVPVIAAGGIADGRQLAAAFVLGACGAQIGTCLLVSKECPIHDNYKEALLAAKDNATVVTGRSVDAPVRIIKNQMSRNYIKAERDGADRMELEKFTLGSLRKAVFDGNVKEGSLMAGQVCGQLHEIRPVADILRDLYEDGKREAAALTIV